MLWLTGLLQYSAGKHPPLSSAWYTTGLRLHWYPALQWCVQVYLWWREEHRNTKNLFSYCVRNNYQINPLLSFYNSCFNFWRQYILTNYVYKELKRMKWPVSQQTYSCSIYDNCSGNGRWLYVVFKVYKKHCCSLWVLWGGMAWSVVWVTQV